MVHIYLNLKRFDVPVELGGVNRLSTSKNWATYIVIHIQDGLASFDKERIQFTAFFPEAHLLPALQALKEDNPLRIGSQSVYRQDVLVNGNFGAFTSLLPAASVKALGCKATLIGHCEERKDKVDLLMRAGLTYAQASHKTCEVLNEEIKCALNQGLDVLYAIGEQEEELAQWDTVLEDQLRTGLKDVDVSRVSIAYEPVWSIGPGKTPADKDYITKVAKFIKSLYPNIPVIYGGGLKEENAGMLASIDEVDGGLIALTQFQGEIGFYPEQYLSIIQTYLNNKEKK